MKAKQFKALRAKVKYYKVNTRTYADLRHYLKFMEISILATSEEQAIFRYYHKVYKCNPPRFKPEKCTYQQSTVRIQYPDESIKYFILK